VRGGLCLGAEDARAFQRDIDAEFLPGSFVGSRSAENLDLAVPDADRSPSTVTVPGKRPCTESKRQQMGVGLDRAEIVDADHFDIGAAGLGDGAQHVAADTAKPV